MAAISDSNWNPNYTDILLELTDNTCNAGIILTRNHSYQNLYTGKRPI